MVTTAKQYLVPVTTRYGTHTQVCNGARQLDMALAAAQRAGHTTGTVTTRPYRAL
jgi:hypothetical protein